MLYGISDIGRNLLGLSSHSERLRANEFWAVNDVSFEVKRGETLGLIGPNGSGKTTILKMLNGIFWPDKGKISIKGRVGALIAVGAGFHPLLTGRENVYINGAILGMSKREIDKKFDAIVEFADIGEFLDTPVKHYSSGMFVRLGFAVAIHCEPEILLVDEVLAVGDVNFQRKCFNKMREIISQGACVILVSHSAPTILSFCKTGLFVEKGKTSHYADIFSVMQSYNYFMDNLIYEQSKLSLDGKVHIEEILFTDIEGNIISNDEVPFLRNFIVTIKYHTELELLSPLICGDILKDNDLVSIVGGHFSESRIIKPNKLPKRGIIRFVIKNQNLIPGAYNFRLGIRGNDRYYYEELLNNNKPFKVADNGLVKGFLYSRLKGDVKPVALSG